jgi:CBS domain-containing protein
MHTQQIMSQSAITCKQNDSLHTAAGLMWKHDCGAIPVVNDEGQLVGMITDRDICMATYLKNSTPQALLVSEVMSKHVVSCFTDTPIERIEELMRANQIRRIPVVDRENHPIGMISLNDFIRYSAQVGDKNGEDRAVMRTMSAICQPRTQSMQH